MEKPDKTITSIGDSFALHSTLTEVIIDFLDEETFPILQNNLMNIINIRYGDSIEAILRNDEKFRHLFEFRKTADFSHSSNNFPKPKQPCSSTIKKYNIFSQTNEIISKTACDINKSIKKVIEPKTKNVLKNSRKQKKMKNVNENVNIDSSNQNNELLTKADSRKVIVEYSNESISMGRTNIDNSLVSKKPLECNILEMNKVRTDNLQVQVQEDQIHNLKRKKEFNSKFESDVPKKKKIIESAVNEGIKKSTFEQNIQNNFPPNKKLGSIKNGQLENMFNEFKISENSSTTLSSKNNIENKRINTQSKDILNIRKLKKPRHVLQKKFEIEASRMKKPHVDVMNKLLKGNKSENTFCEEKINKKTDSTFYLRDKNNGEISSIKTQFINKLETMEPLNDNRQDYKYSNINIKPVQEKENLHFMISHGEIIENKNEIISFSKETKESHSKINKELKDTSVTVKSQYDKTEEGATQDVRQQKAKMSELLKNKYCYSITSTSTDVDKDEVEDIQKLIDGQGVSTSTKYGNEQVKDMIINGEQNMSTLTTYVNRKKELRDNKIIVKQDVSTAESDNNGGEQEVKDIEIKKEQEKSSSKTGVNVEKKEMRYIKIHKEQEIFTNEVTVEEIKEVEYIEKILNDVIVEEKQEVTIIEKNVNDVTVEEIKEMKYIEKNVNDVTVEEIKEVKYFEKNVDDVTVEEIKGVKYMEKNEDDVTVEEKQEVNYIEKNVDDVTVEEKQEVKYIEKNVDDVTVEEKQEVKYIEKNVDDLTVEEKQEVKYIEKNVDDVAVEEKQEVKYVEKNVDDLTVEEKQEVKYILKNVDDVTVEKKQEVEYIEKNVDDLTIEDKKEGKHTEKNVEQDASTFTSVNTEDKEEMEDIKINEEQFVSTSDKKEKKGKEEINEEQNATTFTINVNEIVEQGVKDIKTNDEQDVTTSTKNVNKEIKYSDEKNLEVFSISKDIPEKENDPEITINSPEEYRLHTTSEHKNLIEYIKIPSDGEENTNEMISMDSDPIKVRNPGENDGGYKRRIEVQNELKPVQSFHANAQSLTNTTNNDTLCLQNDLNINNEIRIYSEVKTEEDNTQSSPTSTANNLMKIDGLPNFGGNILLKVVYKTENTQNSIVSVIKTDETKDSTDISIVEKKSKIEITPLKQKYELNGVKNKKKRLHEEMDENYSTPRTMKYNLRSSSSKKKRRRLYGHTEIVTRSHTVNV